ncbi:MAG: TIGR00159 family protein [Chitinophagaceae bacterium]|nr:TIGR00159 family protein [Chitinophagaceae bacterium]
MLLLFKILSHEFSVIDVIDIVLVILLMVEMYRLVRGTLGINIFFGMLLIYCIYLLVKFLKLHYLTEIIGLFVNAGVFALLIVFQPEIRRFLLKLGKAGLGDRENIWDFIRGNKKQRTKQQDQDVIEMLKAIEYFSKNKTGALMVFFSTFKLNDFNSPGVKINAVISAKLLESIFEKASPLHDGAVIVSQNKIVFAGTVLPVSESPSVPERAGLRHRAAIGITEETDAIAVIVSEETGTISFARNGKIQSLATVSELKQVLNEALAS